MKFVQGQFVVPTKVVALQEETIGDLLEYKAYIGKPGIIVMIERRRTYPYYIAFSDGNIQEFAEEELIELNPTTNILYGSVDV